MTKHSASSFSAVVRPLLAFLKSANPKLVGGLRRSNRYFDNADILMDNDKSAIQALKSRYSALQTDRCLLINIQGYEIKIWTRKSAGVMDLIYTTGSHSLNNTFSAYLELAKSCSTEEDWFSKLGLPYLPPHMRDFVDSHFPFGVDLVDLVVYEEDADLIVSDSIHTKKTHRAHRGMLGDDHKRSYSISSISGMSQREIIDACSSNSRPAIISDFGVTWRQSANYAKQLHNWSGIFYAMRKNNIAVGITKDSNLHPSLITEANRMGCTFAFVDSCEKSSIVLAQKCFIQPKSVITTSNVLSWLRG